jgi:choline-sulfatase
MDEQIRWMNHAVWAEDINEAHARVLKARYYGEISYIDQCLGRILDAVESRPDADNTLICFYADHGDHLGDHHAWQKESFFEAACNVPFLVSWPARLAAGTRSDGLVCLADLFGLATSAAGAPELREGADVLGMLEGRAPGRERLAGFYGIPGSPRFKVMIREGEWKYIFMANGGAEQLFNLAEDPHELRNRAGDARDRLGKMRAEAARAADGVNVSRALDGNGALSVLPENNRPLERIYQFDWSRKVKGFPPSPRETVGLG